MHRRVAAFVVAAVALALLPAGSAGSEARPRPRRPRPALAAAGEDGLARALARGRIDEAEYALERASAVFRPARVRGRSGRISGTRPRLATMYLRDLAARIPELEGDDRRRARRVLARPTAPQEWEVGYTAPPEDRRRECTERFCVHWVVSTADAPDVTADADADGTPDWIEMVRDEIDLIWDHVVSLGFRPPKSDLESADNGGDERTDIYIMDLAPQGIYGYCTTDDPNILDPELRYQFFDASAYCVLDNDYAEYPMPGLPSLRVTAAHEFFHAVQFAYDAFEDLWFMEGTAVWMEDEIYDDINDNYQFLRTSHLTDPRVPLDFGDVMDRGKGLFPYGSFLFWRFLSEYPAIAGSPAVIRAIWERADASPSGPHPPGADDYSLLAVEKEVASRGRAFRLTFNDFGVANFTPASFYEEGAAYETVVVVEPPLVRNTRVTTRRPRKAGTAVLDHLSTAYAAFRPGKGVKRRRARVRMTLDGPKQARGTEAALVVFRRDGRRDVLPFRLDRRGDGRVAAPFGRRKVRRVVLVVSNASTRFDPLTRYTGETPYSWGGAVPLDDGLAFFFEARLRQ